MGGEKARIARGLCRVCVQPAQPGHTMCAGHLQWHREKHLKRRAQADAEGLCRICLKQPREPDRYACRPCLDRATAHMKRRSEQLLAHGMCRDCGQRLAALGKTRCSDCLQRHTQRKRARIFGGSWPEVMARDNYCCRLCGKDELLVLHHIDGSGETSGMTANNAPDNLIVLCRLCHSNLEHFLLACSDPDLLVALLRRISLEE